MGDQDREVLKPEPVGLLDGRGSGRRRRLEPNGQEHHRAIRYLLCQAERIELRIDHSDVAASRPDAVGKRAYDAMEQAFNHENMVIRVTGETIALTPPLIVSEREIEEIFAKVARVIKAVA